MFPLTRKWLDFSSLFFYVYNIFLSVLSYVLYKFNSKIFWFIYICYFSAWRKFEFLYTNFFFFRFSISNIIWNLLYRKSNLLRRKCIFWKCDLPRFYMFNQQIIHISFSRFFFSSKSTFKWCTLYTFYKRSEKCHFKNWKIIASNKNIKVESVLTFDCNTYTFLFLIRNWASFILCAFILFANRQGPCSVWLLRLFT